ncbi:MAG: DNA repair protein RecO [Oscillospiraceae bacterium]|jgi:DNA repair protein RecO (recombination protein O)|nr:DNA repair protein RecO [Oscillospiraceae bacterium]
MKVTTAGLVLKEMDIGESDKLITALTEDRGVISVISPGAKRLRTKNSGALQMFYYCELTLFKGRKGYIVDEVEIKERFENLKYDIEKFSLAEYFCEIAFVLSPRESESRDFLRLILNCLYFLLNGKMNLHLIKSILELRICSFAGYMPNLIGCTGCKEYKCDKLYFDIKNSSLICNDCLNGKNNSYDLILINGSVLDAMRHIIYSKFDKLFLFKISDSSIDFLSSICEKYVLEHVDYKFKSLNFFKTINNYALEVEKMI